METLLILTHLTIVLMFGIIFTMISSRLKVPNILMLLIAGIFLGSLTYQGEKFISFPAIFINAIGILALVLVVFDGSSRFKWREFDSLTLTASKIAVSFLLLNIVFLTISTSVIFGVDNVFVSLIFSTLMSGTSADAVLSVFKGKINKVAMLLEVESIINTPITVLLPFITLSIVEQIGSGTVGIVGVFSQSLGILQQFVTGMGAGVLMGIAISKLLRNYYSRTLSPIILITFTLLTYILAENLNGNGVLAVTILGLFFGNFYVKKKDVLFEFSSTFGNSLMILVFVLVGLMIPVPLRDWSFLFNSIILFAVYTAIRSMAVYASTIRENYTVRERIFLTLNFPKGIAVAVMVFTLSTLTLSESLGSIPFSEIPGATQILNLSLLFMIYSLVLSTVVNHFSRYFINLELVK